MPHGIERSEHPRWPLPERSDGRPKTARCPSAATSSWTRFGTYRWRIVEVSLAFMNLADFD
jgi:hypothetical protein